MEYKSSNEFIPKLYTDNYMIGSFDVYLDKTKDEYTLKYLYYDIFNIKEDNLDKIYQELNDLTKKDINKMYNSIIKINTELKNDAK